MTDILTRLKQHTFVPNTITDLFLDGNLSDDDYKDIIKELMDIQKHFLDCFEKKLVE